MSLVKNLRQIRRINYRMASGLGDVIAVSQGPKAVARRVGRKYVWRLGTGILGAILKK